VIFYKYREKTAVVKRSSEPRGPPRKAGLKICQRYKLFLVLFRSHKVIYSRTIGQKNLSCCFKTTRLLIVAQLDKKIYFWGFTVLKDNFLRHNLNVMRIEKYVFDTIFNTMMNVKGKRSHSEYVNRHRDGNWTQARWAPAKNTRNG
jgi:hypothetical protein